jgi:hypothetical protein
MEQHLFCYKRKHQARRQPRSPRFGGDQLLLEQPVDTPRAYTDTGRPPVPALSPYPSRNSYKRALFIAETGREGDQRALWLRYIAEEVRAAFSAGVPVEGICIYPIIDYPGWDNERHCPCGLLGAAQPLSTRPVYEPLAAELRRQQAIFHGSFGEPRGRNLARAG